MVGDALLLFHFVAPAVAAPRAQLPLSVRRGAFDGLDWRTTCIAAFSFLFHFGAVGTAYADFADTTIPDDAAVVAQTVGAFRDLPPLPPVETRDDGKTADAGKAKDAEKNPAPRPAGKAQGAPHPAGGPGAAERQADRRAQEIARQLAAEGKAMLELIGAHNNNGAIGRVMAQGGDLPMGSLDDAAKDAGGSRSADNAGLHLGGGMGGAVRVGSLPGGGLTGPAEVTRVVRENDVGRDNGPRKPIPGTSVAPPNVGVGSLPDAQRVVSGLRGQLRFCYKHELDRDPNAKGTIHVTAKIGTNGEVTSVQTANSGMSSAMADCVKRVVGGAQFGPPVGGGSAMLSFPVTYIPQ
jgi:hypothetical protein